MGKYKICVYAIAKNEIKFAKRWYDSMREADYVCVLDTGSDDGTPELLKTLGAITETKIISPWRFDTARNESQKLIPADADICVCTDIDEVFEKGWREKLEYSWNKDTKRMRYRYTWNFEADGSEGTVFYGDKIHAREGFFWTHPVHEVLQYENGECKTETNPNIRLFHYADSAKPRSQYLELLELSVKESPDDDRNMHYLGREYMFYGKWNKSIAALKKHLSMPSATWADERCASMRYIARCYINKSDKKSAFGWYLRACAEAPHLREPFCETAEFLLAEKDWYGAVCFAKKPLKYRIAN